jgi:hypothetical protein
MAQLRSALGDAEYHRAYARGVALGFDTAIDLALGDAPSAG